MDLNSMLEREDFFNLFFITVEKYYKEAFGKSVKFSFADNNKSCNMVIKPYLSAATTVHISNKARKFFYSEWNIRNAIVKNLAAKSYVAFATRTGKTFSQFKFSFSPENCISDDVVIAPNNRSIRIFDYGNQTVGCIIKNGFTTKFFNNQLQFRLKYKYDFMVPLISYGNDWFQEPILFGHPLARTTKDEVYNKGVQDAMAAIKILADDTYVELKCDEYLNPLLDRAKELVLQAVKKKKIRTFSESNYIIDVISNVCKNMNFTIPTCVSHGDLQSGNIWVDETGKTFIYDWETVDRRSVWYDASVLQYSLRRYEGWKLFFDNPIPVKSIINEKDEHSYTSDEYKVIKHIILLEDILFYLEDMLELPETWGADLYDAFIDRLMQIDAINEAR